MGEHGGFGVACAKSVPCRLACCRVSPRGSRASNPAGRRPSAARAANGFSADAARACKTCDNCECGFASTEEGNLLTEHEDWVNCGCVPRWRGKCGTGSENGLLYVMRPLLLGELIF
jgi:hypothetical protein